MKPHPFEAIAWYQCDHLGTPMELTDEQGNIVWAAQYKAWGEIKEERTDWAKQQGLGNPIRFQGQYHDHETNLHYNRYRYYDLRAGRFICQDPVGYLGGLNLYVYGKNPISWVDPRGLSNQEVCELSHEWGPAQATPDNTPNSIYTQVSGDGAVAVQNTIYDNDGKAFYQVDFKRHGKDAPPGHGHPLSPPGNINSGHGPSAIHVPPEDVPKEWTVIPPGTKPSQK
ncbi:MAG: RHS domain-containing protein [Paucimonas sp.]|nr:RHS domain-containing protein [Paucimonas sp.]